LFTSAMYFLQSPDFSPKIENPPASSNSGGGYFGISGFASWLAQPFPHASMHAHATHGAAATDTGIHRGK
jgi:hypothetical protein